MVPFETDRTKNALLAGAGGGFDFLCALPAALSLLERGHNVFIANYSFTALSKVQNARRITNEILEVDADSTIVDSDYFPEALLSRWFRERKNREVPVYCFPKIGIKSLMNAYNYLAERLSLSTVYIVDGGVDGIFRGDEYDLGTPAMDSISVIAASLCDIPEQLYVMTAFGSEGVNKEVSHAEALNRAADLLHQDALIGTAIPTRKSAAGRDFLDAAGYIFSRMPSRHKSTIVASITDAMEGKFGDTEVNEKTRERPVWLSPLTCLYWFFELGPVARMKLFYDAVLETDSVEEVSNAIEEVREKRKIPSRKSIPI